MRLLSQSTILMELKYIVYIPMQYLYVLTIQVEAKKATKSGVNPPSSGSKGGTKKVFLGGLPPEATDESIRCGLMDCGPIVSWL